MRLDDTVIAQFLRQVFEFQQLYRKHSETCRRNNCFQSLDIDIDESLKSWSTLQSLIVKNEMGRVCFSNFLTLFKIDE